jgi:hypothetical protein
LRQLYNAALEERREAYRKQGVSLSGYGPDGRDQAVAPRRAVVARCVSTLLIRRLRTKRAPTTGRGIHESRATAD